MSIAADLRAYKRAYIALLRELSKAVEDSDSQRVRRINNECRTLIDRMVTDMREAREEAQGRIRVGSGTPPLQDNQYVTEKAAPVAYAKVKGE